MAAFIPNCKQVQQVANDLKYNLTEEQLGIVVSQEWLVSISEHMNNWRLIAPYLGLPQTTIEDIEENKGPQRLLLLQKWKEKHGRKATICTLAEAFLKAKRRDLAEKVLEVFKQNEPTAKPFTIQDEETPLVEDKRQHTTREQDDACSSICMCIFCYIILALPAIPFLAVGITIYSPKVPQPGTFNLIQNSVVLLGEFNPFYIDKVTYTSSTTDTLIYKPKCQNITVNNHTVTQTKDINLTQGKTYPIFEEYLVDGSKLDANFTFSPKHNYTTGEECLAVIYQFEDLANYFSFLKYGIKYGFSFKQCIQNEAMFRYSLNASKSSYYPIGLYVPQDSVFESVKFEMSGYKLLFNVTRSQPDCIVTPDQPECIVELTKTQNSNSHNNYCILGTTPNNVSQVKYTPQVYTEIGTLKLFFLIYGGIGAGFLSFYTCVCCCTCCLVCLLKN